VRRFTPLLAAVLAPAVLSLTPASADAKVLWLCKPGLRANPCEPSLTTTLFSPSGKPLRAERTRRPARPKADCFYLPDVTWGTHLADGSIAPGTLVDLVRREIKIWGERQH